MSLRHPSKRLQRNCSRPPSPPPKKELQKHVVMISDEQVSLLHGEGDHHATVIFPQHSLWYQQRQQQPKWYSVKPYCRRFCNILHLDGNPDIPVKLWEPVQRCEKFLWAVWCQYFSQLWLTTCRISTFWAILPNWPNLEQTKLILTQFWAANCQPVSLAITVISTNTCRVL